jgi:hypothetical protein
MTEYLLGAYLADVSPAVVSFLRSEPNGHGSGRNRDRAQADHLVELTNVGIRLGSGALGK